MASMFNPILRHGDIFICIRGKHFFNTEAASSPEFLDVIASLDLGYEQGLVKGAKLCLNPYFFGWLEK